MKKKFFILVMCLGLSIVGYAQGEQGSWSLELNLGQNNAVRPYAEGYAANTEGGFRGIGIDHFDFGVRYMFSDNFGGKLDMGYDAIGAAGTSLPFDTKSTRFGLQLVVDLGRVCALDEVSDRLGLLVHAGPQLSIIKPSGRNAELSRGFMFGITPQFKLNDRLALTADFTVIQNRGQDYNWDGSTAKISNNLDGMMYNSSLGLTYFLN